MSENAVLSVRQIQEMRVQGRSKDARRDGIHMNSFWRPFRAEALGEHGYAALTHAVWHGLAQADERAQACNVNDFPTLLSGHLLCEHLARQERSFEVAV